VTPVNESVRFRLTLPKDTCIRQGLDEDESTEVDVHAWDELGIVLVNLGGADLDPVEFVETAATDGGQDDA
jgi:hypothetical protein